MVPVWVPVHSGQVMKITKLFIHSEVSTYLLTYNLTSLSGPNSARAKDPIDVKSDEAIQI
jgi:hypothetical protein